MRSSSKYVVGALFVIFGILVIFGNGLSWIFKLTWPMILIAIAFFFFLGYFTRRPYGAGFLVPGGIFLTLGVTFLLSETFSYGLFWPGFIAAPAVGLLLLYLFGERSPGLLVPIGIILTVAATCTLAQLFNAWGVMWPGFIMAPAVGLFLLYVGGNRDSGLLIPVFILTAISVTFFSIFFLGHFAGIFKYVAGGALILVGITTIFKKPSHRSGNGGNDYYGHQ